MPSAPEHDQESNLVARIRRGDERAFESLYLAHHDELWRFAYTYVRSRDVAEELVQDVFLAVWGTRATWEVEGQRWFDLSRWGILDAVIRAKTTMMQTLQPGETEIHGVPSNLFPIPDGQINSNGLLTQNPGW